MSVPTEEVLTSPRAAYTKALLEDVPKPEFCQPLSNDGADVRSPEMQIG
jgi:ABC-type oligopeptide transport system ATPase subunit